MKPITEKQINAIEKLARATKTQVNNIEEMSSVEASQLITALIEKRNGTQQNSSRNYSKGNDYMSGALAGLAVKILAQRCKIEEIIGNEERFKQRAVELHKVLSSARQECLV